MRVAAIRSVAVGLSVSLLLLLPSTPIRASSSPWISPGPDEAGCLEGFLGGYSISGAVWDNHITIGVACGYAEAPAAMGVFRPDGSLLTEKHWFTDVDQTNFALSGLTPAGRWLFDVCLQAPDGIWSCDLNNPFTITHAAGDPAPVAATPAPPVATPAPTPRATPKPTPVIDTRPPATAAPSPDQALLVLPSTRSSSPQPIAADLATSRPATGDDSANLALTIGGLLILFVLIAVLIGRRRKSQEDPD